LLWLDPIGRGGWFIDIDDERAVPVCRARAEVEELFAEALLDITEGPWLGGGEVLSETQALRRDAAWQAIKPIALVQPDSFDPHKRSALILSQANEGGPSRYSLYRLLRRWWQRGMTQSALTPDYANSGGPGQRKTDRGVKRGAPVKYGSEGMNLDDEVRKAFRDSVTRYYAQNKELNVADCDNKCLELHFCDPVISEETGLHVQVADDPLTCVARGGGRALELVDMHGNEFFAPE
jgi:hypothetical protein